MVFQLNQTEMLLILMSSLSLAPYFWGDVLAGQLNATQGVELKRYLPEGAINIRHPILKIDYPAEHVEYENLT